MVSYYAPLSAGALALCAFSVAHPALASTELEYEAPPDCPSEAGFRAAVNSRGGEFDRPDVDGSIRRVDISIHKRGTAFVGSFKTELEGSGFREVSDSSCVEVSNGLALITAIAMIGVPGAAGAQPNAPVAAVASPLAAPEPLTQLAAPSPPSAAERKDALRGSGDTGSLDVPVEAGTLSFNKARSLSLSGGVAIGVIPSLILPKYDLSFTVANFVTAPGAGDFLVGPIVKVGFGWLGLGTHEEGEYSTRVQGASINFSACYSPLYDTAGLVLLACGEYTGTVLDFETKNGDGEETSKTAAVSRFGLGLDAEYNVSSLFHLGLKGGVQGALNRMSAERPDGSKLFETGYVSGYVGGSLGVHF